MRLAIACTRLQKASRELTFAVDEIKSNRIAYLDGDGSRYSIQVLDKPGIKALSHETRYSSIEKLILKET